MYGKDVIGKGREECLWEGGKGIKGNKTEDVDRLGKKRNEKEKESKNENGTKESGRKGGRKGGRKR